MSNTITIRYEAILAAAKTLAGFNNEGWLFEPPIMDGVIRSAEQSSDSYLLQAEAVLHSAAKAGRHARELGVPVSDGTD